MRRWTELCFFDCFHHLMPSPDTIALQSSLRTCVHVECLCSLSHGRNLPNFLYLRKDKLFSGWNTGLQLSGQRASKSGHSMMPRPFLVKAVATISQLDKAFSDLQEEKINSENELQSVSSQVSVDDLKERDSKNNERKMKIGKSNKGKVPWNKGKKHSPETIARIRERTRLAMQDLKIRKKLVEKASHPQSEETKMKIGMSVRRASLKRQKEQQLEETCLLEWEESIAEAARIGGDGEDELQWDSYKILKEKIHQDWLQVVEMRKKDRRAPKSVEQKMKISEAIKAKWADPDYRQRVQSGRRNTHGNRPPSAVERVGRKRSHKVGEQLPSSKTPYKISKYSQVHRKKLLAPYVDPLADAKLEKIKQLRANRAKIEMSKHEAVERARLLIAEAEKAAKALEAAAVTDNIARASLFETKKLLAEAVQTMQSVQSVVSCNEHTLKRSPGSSFDENPLRVDTQLNNSHIPASATPEVGDENDMHFPSFSSNCKTDNYDDFKSTVGNVMNDTLSGNIYHYAHEPNHSTEIGGEKVLSYVASQFSTSNLSAEEIAIIFKSVPDKRTGKESMSISEENSTPTLMTVNYAGIVDEPAIANTDEKHMPEHTKDNILSVTANSVASKGPIQSIAEMSESRSFQVDNNDVLASNKDIKKRWVRGRLVEAKGD